MKIYCIELQKEFESHTEMFAELKASEKHIISLKKAAIQKSVNKGQFAPSGVFSKLNEASKAALNIKEDYIYPVINTSWYFDNHRDVHGSGLWAKSLKEQKGQIHYVADHSLKLQDIIAWPEDVNAFTRNIPWMLVGKNYTGETQALIYEIKKESIQNEAVMKAIEEGRNLQNSVRMQYVKIKFAVNSNEKDYVDNKKIYDDNINKIANKDEVEEFGYFWLILEAKIHREGSMVLFGSNDATAIITTENVKGAGENHSAKDNQPPQSTGNNQPSEDTDKRNYYLNLLKNQQ